MTTRYAYIDKTNNNTIWGPGPNPYFLTLTDGSLWEITAHTVEESEKKGIYIVEQKNKKDFDENFEEQLTPEYDIIKGRPRETWSYNFIPAARGNMIKGVDEYAEKIRASLATNFSGQYQEYDEVYKEALEVNALPLQSNIPVGKYPFLEADVNVTFSEDLDRKVENVREAANLVIQKRNMWKDLSSQIRKSRLLIKNKIREAETDAIAYSLYKQFLITGIEFV